MKSIECKLKRPFYLRCCHALHRYGLQPQDASGLHRIDIHDGARDGLVVVKSSQPDAVVWNPWEAKSKARAGSRHERAKTFLSVF